MNNNNDLSFLYSWPVIVIALIIFWPVGIYLIVKRVSSDKKSTMNSAKTIKYLGIGSYCIAALGVLAVIGDFTFSNLLVVIVFGIAGYALSKLSAKVSAEAESVKQYLSIIVNGNVRSLDEIAAAKGKPYDETKADIQKMIDKGFLNNAYINENTREVVLTQNRSAPQPAFAPGVQPAAATVQPRVVTCSCCGANNTVVGSVGECEYCGSPLQ